jgi:hypothetical protein
MTTNLILRSIKVPSGLWASAKKKAEHDGLSLSAVIRAMLEVYVNDYSSSQSLKDEN